MWVKKSIRVWECHTCGKERSCAIIRNELLQQFQVVCYACDNQTYEKISEEQKERWLRGANP
tara:strand:- start:2120 stop:2305 length:186 start_codon:yes stop_codon:yes gene_type:complete